MDRTIGGEINEEKDKGKKGHWGTRKIQKSPWVYFTVVVQKQ